MNFTDDIKRAIKRAESAAIEMCPTGRWLPFCPDFIYGLGDENVFLFSGADLEAINEDYTKRDYHAVLQQTHEWARTINAYQGDVCGDYRFAVVCSAFLAASKLVSDLAIFCGLKNPKGK